MVVVVTVVMMRRHRDTRRCRVGVGVADVVGRKGVVHALGTGARGRDEADGDRGHAGRRDDGQGCQASAKAASEQFAHVRQPFRPSRRTKRPSRAPTVGACSGRPLSVLATSL